MQIHTHNGFDTLKDVHLHNFVIVGNAEFKHFWEFPTMTARD
jgi:hypothetical protein